MIILNTELFQTKEKLVFAVSGNLDSMFLLQHLMEQPTLREKIAVAHVNQRLHNKSDEIYRFVESFCINSEIPFYGIRCPIPGQNSENVEKFMYSFFEMLMMDLGSTHLLMGYQLNDNTSHSTLSKSDKGYWIHQPLLQLPKEMIYQQMVNRDFLWYEKTESDLKFEDTKEIFLKIDDIQKEQETFIDELVEKKAENQIQHENGMYKITKSLFLSEPLLVQRKLLQTVLEQLGNINNSDFLLQNLKDKVSVKHCTSDWYQLEENVWVYNTDNVFYLANDNEYFLSKKII